MKPFLSILLLATVIFMGLAMAQEWEVFSGLFMPAEQPEALPTELPEEVRDALEHFNTVLAHLYRYGGDERFLERLPASENIRAELRADLDYLAQNGLLQDLELVESTHLSDRLLATEVWEVRTEEEWEMAYYDHTGNPISTEPMSFIVNQRYVIRNTANGWVVVTMEPAPSV